MDKLETLYKIEYFEYAKLLKIMIYVRRLQDIIECNQKKVTELQKGDYLEHLLEESHLCKMAIEQLTNLAISDYDLDVNKKLEFIDCKIFEGFPNVVENLIQGRYDYNWSFQDFTFNFYEFSEQSRIREIYRCYFKIEQLEEDLKGLIYIGHVNNPIFFDILHLFFVDNKYINLLDTFIRYNIYNPNCLDCKRSFEPFYGRIMNRFRGSDFASIVALDERTDFRLLINGTDELEFILKNANDQVFSSSFSLLFNILKNKNVSVIDTIRFNGNRKESNHEAYIVLISELKNCDLEEVQDLITYCVSDQMIEKQLNFSIYPSIYRDFAIDTYCELIEEKRGEGVEGISKLKMMKLD